MRTFLLTIGFAFSGILSSLAWGQVVPLTVDPAQSSVVVTIGGSPSSSTLSGDATIDLQFSNPPSGNAQVTSLDIVADEAINASLFFGVVSISAPPGEVTVSMVTPGTAGVISGTSFDQLNNQFALGGTISVSDPLGFAGGNQSVDLSTLDVSPFDLSSIEVTQNGTTITVSNSFTINESADAGGIAISVVVDVTYVASGQLPVVATLLGDVDLSGTVDFADIAPFIAVLSNGSFQAEADIDQNLTVDFADIGPFIDILAAP